MKNIDVSINKEELQAEILLLKERNRELEETNKELEYELFNLKKVPVMKNDENEKLERKLMTIYGEIVHFRAYFERFIKNKKLNDLKEELDKKNKDIEWTKETIESLYDEVNYKIKNFEDIK